MTWHAAARPSLDRLRVRGDVHQSEVSRQEGGIGRQCSLARAAHDAVASPSRRLPRLSEVARALANDRGDHDPAGGVMTRPTAGLRRRAIWICGVSVLLYASPVHAQPARSFADLSKRLKAGQTVVITSTDGSVLFWRRSHWGSRLRRAGSLRRLSLLRPRLQPHRPPGRPRPRWL